MHRISYILLAVTTAASAAACMLVIRTFDPTAGDILPRLLFWCTLWLTSWGLFAWVFIVVDALWRHRVRRPFRAPELAVALACVWASTTIIALLASSRRAAHTPLLALLLLATIALSYGAFRVFGRSSVHEHEPGTTS